MMEIISALNLIDLFRARHSTQPPATYARGQHQLDYAWGTTKFVDAMVACGFEAFNERFHTDHRAYFLDFYSAILFGNNTSVLALSTRRGFTSCNVKQNTEYLEKKHAPLLPHNSFERAKKKSHPGYRHQFAERLDRDVHNASLAAEKHVTFFGAPKWSKALAKASEKVVILTKCLSMAKKKLDQSAIIAKMMQEQPTTMILPTTLQECKSQLQVAKQEVKGIVNSSFAHWTQERDEKIRQLEIRRSPIDKKQAKRLRRMKQAEETKQDFEKMQHLRSKGSRRGFTMLEIPQNPEDNPRDCEQWQTIEIPTEILTKMQERNQLHFGQAQGTPFTVEPLVSDVGFRGDKVEATAIWDGKYDINKPEQGNASYTKEL